MAAATLTSCNLVRFGANVHRGARYSARPKLPIDKRLRDVKHHWLPGLPPAAAGSGSAWDMAGGSCCGLGPGAKPAVAPGLGVVGSIRMLSVLRLVSLPQAVSGCKSADSKSFPVNSDNVWRFGSPAKTCSHGRSQHGTAQHDKTCNRQLANSKSSCRKGAFVITAGIFKVVVNARQQMCSMHY
jgi:hypothetical protein